MIATLRFDMICQLMAINKALVTDSRERGYLQDVLFYWCREGKEKAEISANRNLNNVVKDLKHRGQGKCEVGWRGGGKEMGLYLHLPNRQPPNCNVCILQFDTAGRWQDAGEHHKDPL